jgi:S1-C subfamily serine protease
MTVTSGKKDTLVTGWDPRLPRCEKNGQYVVITEPDTNPGDSGAALIDSDDKPVGFARKRTGFGEKIEFAEWIWARSVLDAHGLR